MSFRYNVYEVVKVKDEKKIRKQIYLKPLQNEQIKLLSGMQQKTEAQIIREAIDNYLKENEQSLEDPITELIGMVEDGYKHGSTTHDDIYFVNQEETNETR